MLKLGEGFSNATHTHKRANSNDTIHMYDKCNT